MAILVYANTANNEIHKSAFEAVSYGAQIAEKTNDTVIAIVAGNASGLESLGKFGADKVVHVNSDQLADFQPTLIAEAIQKTAESNDSKIVIFCQRICIQIQTMIIRWVIPII